MGFCLNQRRMEVDSPERTEIGPCGGFWLTERRLPLIILSPGRSVDRGQHCAAWSRLCGEMVLWCGIPSENYTLEGMIQTPISREVIRYGYWIRMTMAMWHSLDLPRSLGDESGMPKAGLTVTATQEYGCGSCLLCFVEISCFLGSP